MTRLYRIYDCWVDSETAKELLLEFVSKHGHACNQIADPDICCPVAHGASIEKCTCAILETLQFRDYPSTHSLVTERALCMAKTSV